jgi:hypothetical protein
VQTPVVGLLLCVLGTIPLETVVRDRFDTIEINSLYDDNGQHVFSQVLFRRFDKQMNREVIEDWRLLKRIHNVPAQQIFIFFDDQDHVLRRVTYNEVRETFTQHDPELIDREHLPKEMRQGLTKPLRR